MRPHGLLGGLLGLLGNVVSLATGILLPNGADTAGAVVAPEVLRHTLGVDNTSWTGRGIGVAVIDSGLEPSSEFSNRVTAFYDFTYGQTTARTAYDDYGHGTHVAGIIGGSGALSRNYSYHGLAPKVRFVILKALDRNGAGYTSDVIRAVDFAVANRVALGIDVINLSLGHPIFEPAATDPLVQAVERATRGGVIVVAAAGNYGKNPQTGVPGYGGITSPGNAPSAITVGAVNIQNTVQRDDDRIPDYSSSGPTWLDAFVKPDVVSPGHNIVAVAAKQGTLYKNYPQLKDEDADYMLLSGTSMSTAVTTGSIALLLEANRAANNYPQHPSLTPNAVKGILEYTAFHIHNDAGLEYDPLRIGRGHSTRRARSTSPGSRIPLRRPEAGGCGRTRRRGRTSTASTSNGSSQSSGAPRFSGAPRSASTRRRGARRFCGAPTSPGAARFCGAPTSCGPIPSRGRTRLSGGSNAIGYDSGSSILWGTSGPTPETTAWKPLNGSTASTSGQ